MAKYIDAEKLKAEIKHLKLDVWDEAHQFDLGARSALSYIEQFLTSLQQEQQEEMLDKDLNEAAEEYAFNNWEDNDYHTGASEGLHFDAIGHTANCLKAGAEWMAGQGETIDGSLCYDPHLQQVIVFLEDCPKMWEGSIMDVTVQIRKKED